MRRMLFVFLAMAIFLAPGASAQVKFKDVPADHWAAPYVYELVQLGVTNGYPDGTFRGTKNITRYETAVFLAKLSNALGGDLQKDVESLKQEVASLKQGGSGFATAGNVAMDWKLGNLLASAGGSRAAVADYRLILSSEKKLGEGANVKINLDTMDYGYLNDGSTATGGILATELLDIEGNLKLNLAALGFENPVDLKLAYGPGAKEHSADPTGTLPSEVGVVYNRPDTGISAATTLWGMDVSGGYIAKSHPTSGKVDIADLNAGLGYTFGSVPLLKTLRLETAADYISAGVLSSTNRKMMGVVSLSAPLAEKVAASGKLGFTGRTSHNMMVAGELGFNDVWETGTVATIRASKIGESYLDTGTFQTAMFDMAGLDTFSRALQNNTVNLGGELVQSVSDSVKLVGKGEIRLNGDYKYDSPKGAITAQGGILYAIAPNTNLDASYRLFQNKATSDTSDIAAVGLMYNF